MKGLETVKGWARELIDLLLVFIVLGVTVQIMRKGITLPHEISVFSEEELRIRSEAETTEVEVVEEASE